MRIKFNKYFYFLLIFLKIIIAYYILRISYTSIISNYIVTSSSSTSSLSSNIMISKKPPTKHLSKLISIVIRDFDLSENDIFNTVESFVRLFPSVQIIILYDQLPYPNFHHLFMNCSYINNLKMINLSPKLDVKFSDNYPLKLIKTKYVLFVPDSTRITNRQILQLMLNELKNSTEYSMIGVSVKDSINCLSININLREWTLKYNNLNKKNFVCDAISGKHVLLIKSEILFKLSNAFLQPFPQTLYIQTAYQNLKVKIMKKLSFPNGKSIMKSYHAKWKRKKFQQEQLKVFYKNYQIKKVIRESDGTVEWYGCNRDTPRCFGNTIIDRMPSYLYENKWTPPCCLENLRKTARYVFDLLDNNGVRYWLEAGSLLGAMRYGDILPWDYNIDIGFNNDDLNRNQWLKKSKIRSTVDTKGFLWEKATEGNFFRVYFSKQNRISVNLYPFYGKNGTMKRDAWFINNNWDFPDIFLHPMSSIEFLGRNIPSPNNIRDFLELKYGKGCVEKPQYPNPNRLPFP